MKQYVFMPEDIGRKDWPSGELRLEGIEKTEDPQKADLFVCPGPLSMFHDDPQALERFPHIKGKENRLIAFDVSDYETMFSVRDPIMIRCNTRPRYYDAHPNTISWAWPVEDYAECVEVPDGGFSFDLSFQGWLSSNARIDASASCQRELRLHSDIATYSDFCGYIFDTPEGIRRRAEFRRSMRESRIALCPESIPGVFPYRFWESLSAGRVPCLVGSDFVFPLADRIPYSEFCIFVSRADAHSTGSIIREFLRGTSDTELIEMGRLARHYWKLYLNREDWPRRMAEEVLLKLGSMEPVSCA